MTNTLWMPHVAVSHHAAAQSAFGPPVVSANAAGDHTQFSADAIQFGFCAYEGIRVHFVGNQYLVFRARDHHERMARSCAALAMPCPDYDTFVGAIRLAVESNHDGRVRCLYVRPIVFAAGGGIMPQQDDAFTYAALCTEFNPDVGSLGVVVETEHPRTVPAFAAVKTATNYTNSALVTRRARDLGYDTVLWLAGDGSVRECTTMNIFLHVDGEILTPELGDILPGVTRRTMIDLLRAAGSTVVEKTVHVTEMVAAIESGRASGVFTTSTALGVRAVGRLRYRDEEYKLDAEWPATVAAARETYRALTEDFPSGLAAHQGIAERSFVGVV